MPTEGDSLMKTSGEAQYKEKMELGRNAREHLTSLTRGNVLSVLKLFDGRLDPGVEAQLRRSPEQLKAAISLLREISGSKLHNRTAPRHPGSSPGYKRLELRQGARILRQLLAIRDSIRQGSTGQLDASKQSLASIPKRSNTFTGRPKIASLDVKKHAAFRAVLDSEKAAFNVLVEEVDSTTGGGGGAVITHDIAVELEGMFVNDKMKAELRDFLLEILDEKNVATKDDLVDIKTSVDMLTKTSEKILSILSAQPKAKARADARSAKEKTARSGAK